MGMQAAARGLDRVEEMDPLERMRMRYGLDAESVQKPQVKISSLEEELEELQRTLDIKNFDYVPVPREEGEEPSH
jgi:hypothetical protein